jgi:hypothetical protein
MGKTLFNSGSDLSFCLDDFHYAASDKTEFISADK